MAGSIDLRSLISQQALAQGVPAAIALSVAQQESGVSQWTQSGGLVTGSSGEIGVFQLMPATAASLGVDPTDVSQNIAGGVSFLKSLFAKYGNWSAALSAYNSGSPTGSPSYAASVLARAGLPMTSPSPVPSLDLSAADLEGAVENSGYLIPALILGGIGAVWWLLD